MSDLDVVTTQVRIPREIWEWLGKQSIANIRSRNAEVVWSLRQRMTQDREQDQQREQVR